MHDAVSPALLCAARDAGAWAGVTRLAELTRLDEIGLPVWQAVRPMGRALSTHQGKGSTDAAAQVGALMEAAESHAAESFAGEGPLCRFRELAASERAPRLDDYARSRRCGPDPEARHRWIAAEGLGDGGILHLPFDLVSLDLTRDCDSAFQRSSDGNAAGITREAARLTALCEVIERDALAEWRALGLVERSGTALALGTIPFGWFADWRERLRGVAMSLRVYRLPAIIAMPTFVCEIVDGSRAPDGYRATWGSGTHGAPEIALFRAFSEALQSRATCIAGARDDLLPSAFASSQGAVFGFGLPANQAFQAAHWDWVAPGPEDFGGIVGALAEIGYDKAAVLDLAQVAGVTIVKAFVCGLGAGARRRRPA